MSRKTDANEILSRTDKYKANLAEPSPVAGQLSLPTIPADLWDARPILADIGNRAHARGTSRDVALYTVLANAVAVMPPTLVYNTGILSPVSPNVCIATVAESGIGKTTSGRAAREWLPAGMCRPLPIGSGEGLIDMFYDTVEIPPPAGSPPGTKSTKVRKRVSGNSLVVADEGEVLGKLLGRSGATLGAMIRAGWSGDVIGQSNASDDKKRVLDAGSYVLVVMVGMQPKVTVELLADTATGMAQRFLWVAALDPHIPAALPPGLRSFGPLDWQPPKVPGDRSAGDKFLNPYDPDQPALPIPVAQQITDELWAHHVKVRRGDLQVAEHDSQRPAQRVKLAGALMWLDQRVSITTEDWQLSGSLLDASDGVRDRLLEYSADAKREELTARGFERARVSRAEDQADDTRTRCKANVRKIVSEAPDGATWRDLTNRLSRFQRDFLPEVLADLIENKVITEDVAPNGGRRYRETGKPS